VGLVLVVSGDGQRGRGDNERAVEEGDRVVAGGQTAGSDGVGTGVHRRRRAAAEAQRPAQNARALAIHEPAIGDLVAGVKNLAVIHLTFVVGGDGQRSGVDGEAAVDVTDRIVAGVTEAGLGGGDGVRRA